MQYRLNVGDSIPKFSSYDQEGNEITDEDLISNPCVIYFYPRDDTPVCTKEACSFRDQLDEFEKLESTVIGISPDSQESHQRFTEKHNINFTLLSDENLELCRKFDVLKEKTLESGEKKMGLERSTFVCDSEGIIQWIERPVNIDGHLERVLQALKECK